MTRFARAKGSKSSNEKAPEDSTPWEVMKEQLVQSKKQNEDTKNREEAEKQRIENYENFLKDQKTQKRKSTWCDFPEDAVQKTGTSLQNIGQSQKKKVKKQSDIASSNPEVNNEELNVPKGKNLPPSNDIKKKSAKKKKKKNKDTTLEEGMAKEITDNNSEVKQINSSALDTKSQKKRNKQQKKNKLTNINAEEPNNQVCKDGNSINNQNGSQTQKKKKEPKFINGKPVRRKAVNDNSFQFIINGKEIELERFDGFPVMKRDAERLKELKNNMIKKGIPKSEVQRTMKLERRRAEKALARLKREVCYNCRKGGHNLSDCPDLKTKIPGAGASDGICFKCGSTEHRQFECKVQRDKEFRFATCFICKEPGHIARQCPDNPKGLYPNGGNCKLCGDVTHLRKDCPTVMDKKEESNFKLQTLESADNVEGIGQQNQAIASNSAKSAKKPKKIKF